MKREGRQRGLVRTCGVLPAPLNQRPVSVLSRRIDARPTAGLFTKAPSKPTNHSKFTGKCGRLRCLGCHMHPISKSKDKTKGTQKLKSADVVTNYRLIAWRVVDGRPGLKLSGCSATGILDHLSNDYDEDSYEEDDNCDNYDDYDDDSGRHDDYGLAPYIGALVDRETERPEIEEIIDDDDMGFYDVGIAFERGQEDEGWFLVGEI